MAGIFRGEQHHIDALLLGRPVLPVRMNRSAWIDGLDGHLGHGLQSAHVDLASHDGSIDIIGAVEASHDDRVAQAGCIQGSLGAQRHGVVTADDALDVGVLLEQAFHHIEGLSPATSSAVCDATISMPGSASSTSW